MQYAINVSEVYEKTYKVEAESCDEAINAVNKLYADGTITARFTGDDLTPDSPSTFAERISCNGCGNEDLEGCLQCGKCGHDNAAFYGFDELNG